MHILRRKGKTTKRWIAAADRGATRRTHIEGGRKKGRGKNAPPPHPGHHLVIPRPWPANATLSLYLSLLFSLFHYWRRSHPGPQEPASPPHCWVDPLSPPAQWVSLLLVLCTLLRSCPRQQRRRAQQQQLLLQLIVRTRWGLFLRPAPGRWRLLAGSAHHRPGPGPRLPARRPPARVSRGRSRLISGQRRQWYRWRWRPHRARGNRGHRRTRWKILPVAPPGKNKRRQGRVRDRWSRSPRRRTVTVTVTVSVSVPRGTAFLSWAR